MTFFERSLQMQFGDRGLTQIMNSPGLGQQRVNEARDRVAPLITQIVERAKQQGSLRQDFYQTDVVFMQLGLSAIIDSTRGMAPALYRRYLVMWLDGVRTDRTQLSDLPAHALTADQTHNVMTRGLRSRNRISRADRR